MRSEIQNGADFGTEAAKYSDDEATQGAGGELGNVIRGQMVPEFEEAVFGLKKGELSQPVRTQYGYHLIQVTDITPEAQIAYDQVKEKIRSALLAQHQADDLGRLAGRAWRTSWASSTGPGCTPARQGDADHRPRTEPSSTTTERRRTERRR